MLVVDDGSEPGISLSPPAASMRVQFIQQRRSGPAAARNRGLEAAEGELVVFTDDDCRAHPDWLDELARGYASDPEAGFGGAVQNALTDNVYSCSSQILIDYLYDYFNPEETGCGFFTSNNLAFPATALRALGGFDLSFTMAAGEDRELCGRWMRHGRRMIYLPKARVYHSHDLSFRRFLRQHFNYGRGAWNFHKVQAARWKHDVRLEPLSFYVGLLRRPFREPTPRPFTTSVLLTLAQAANACGFFYQRLTEPKSRAVRELPSRIGIAEEGEM